MMRLKNLVPTAAKLQLFRPAILPYLTYCHLTWRFCLASDKRKLERIHERGLRVVFRNSKSAYKKLLNKAKLITLYERRLQGIARLMYKMKHGMCPQSVRDLLIVNSTGSNFRGADLHIPRFHSVTYGKHSLRYLGPKLWNSLPSNLRNLPSLQSLKRQIVRIAYYVATDTQTDLIALFISVLLLLLLLFYLFYFFIEHSS